MIRPVITGLGHPGLGGSGCFIVCVMVNLWKLNNGCLAIYLYKARTGLTDGLFDHMGRPASDMKNCVLCLKPPSSQILKLTFYFDEFKAFVIASFSLSKKPQEVQNAQKSFILSPPTAA
jgi:hypothetical protein